MFRALLYGLIPVVLASTDPQISTPSATATVPSFVVESDQVAPSAPVLLRPTDHAVTGDPRPELVWRHSTDEDSNTVLYTLYLNGVATFLGISGTGNSSGNGFTARVEAGDIRLLPTTSLLDGVYTWRVDAYDLSGNSSHSTTWSFTIDSTALTHLPATISQIDSRLRLSYYLAIPLAIAIIILLIIIWRRRDNLILLNAQLHPLHSAIIYHSIPNQKSDLYHLGPSDHGRLHIPHLGRYSTLTIRQQGSELCTTHILSISGHSRLYTIVL